jgi:hypothetical protein
MDWNPVQKRRGRSRKRAVEEESMEVGKICREVKRITVDRIQQRFQREQQELSV